MKKWQKGTQIYPEYVGKDSLINFICNAGVYFTPKIIQK
jgi:hypothetical protein